MEVNDAEPQEASVAIQSLKRKVIRAESEETQDYVCQALAISQEEAEEMGVVPSALCEPRGSIYWCDNRCSEKAVRYWHTASMVVGEGGAAPHNQVCVRSATTNSLCSRASRG